MKRWLTLGLCCLPLVGWATVEGSAVLTMEGLSTEPLQGKLPATRIQQIEWALSQQECFLRVVSFNMLFNHPWSEETLEPSNRWEERLPRIVDYLCLIQPDLIGTQELQPDQIDDLMERIGGEYEVVRGQSSIFYKRERLCLLGKSEWQSPGPKPKAVLVGYFWDRRTGREIAMLNTHLSFGDVEARHCQALFLAHLAERVGQSEPVVVTGDFNSFSAQRDSLGLPFLDGDQEMAILTGGSLRDARFTSLLGHFGPIASTNYNAEEKRAFAGLGTPGIILDHILVSGQFTVVRHAIDPATVDGGWLSDHFPVLADLLLTPLCAGPCNGRVCR